MFRFYGSYTWFIPLLVYWNVVTSTSICSSFVLPSLFQRTSVAFGSSNKNHDSNRWSNSSDRLGRINEKQSSSYHHSRRFLVDKASIDSNDGNDVVSSDGTTESSSSSTPAAVATTKPSSTTTVSSTTIATELEPKQKDFLIGYLNKHHKDFLSTIVEAFTAIGSELAQENAFSRGTMIIEDTKIINVINTTTITLEVRIQKRNQKDVMVRSIDISFNANPIPERERFYGTRPIVADDVNRLPIDDFIRRLCRLAWITKHPTVTGKLIQLAIQLDGAGIGKIPENMFLNQVPHNRFVRQWFYDKASEAVKDAVVLCSEGILNNRMKVICKFPETNPTMDSYRIGTILELVRSITIRLAEENLRVRVCVQGSMGVGIFTGMPKQLSGVARLLQAMDWQTDVGEINEGMVGDYVRFGEIGKQHVLNEIKSIDNGSGKEVIEQYQDDVFIIIAPQSMVGTETSIMPLLQEMTMAAGDRPIILFNPDLTDKISSGGQQSIRGRQQRIDFDNSFHTIFHFQNIYISGTSYFPILGATTKLHPINEPWIAHQRRDFMDGDELYVPVLADETLPTGESIMQAFER